MKSIITALGLALLGTNVYAIDNETAVSSKNPPTQSSNMITKSTNDAFLAENKKKEGVITLENGLQYKVLTEGTGKKPTQEDLVTVNYEGTLVDGTEFDSSYKRGQPATFPVRAVIPGWVQALQLMKEGSTWMLYIPSQLAYGERGAPPIIGPNQTLIFKVNLIAIKK